MGGTAYPPLKLLDDQVLNAEVTHSSGTPERERGIDDHRASESGEAG
jgi:hypothetical protein